MKLILMLKVKEKIEKICLLKKLMEFLIRNLLISSNLILLRHLVYNVEYVGELKMKKVQIAIQGEQLRVTSPSRDALQEVMAFLKEQDYGLELNFGNYR